MKKESEEEESLMGHADNSSASAQLYRNFLIMCIAFSINHGCVVSCLAYASTELGNELASYGGGLLYIFYAFTAFFLSKPIVSMIGPKNGLLVGCSGYCIYVAGFLFAIMVPSAAYPVFLTAASIGGVSGGFLWTSQGRYFAKNSSMYASITTEPTEKVNADFAGIFATSYLGIEMITKVLATVIFITLPDSASFIIFTIYTALALISCFIIFSLSSLDENGTWDFSFSTIMSNTLSAGSLILSDPRLALLVPFQVAFGFASSFVPYYVFGTVIAGSSDLGSTWVGLLSAIIVLTGASMGIPSAMLANKFGKATVMSVGGLCIAFAGWIFFFVSDSALGTWGMIVPFLIIYGVGRGTWENTNKAVVADFYVKEPSNSMTAFAAIAFSNGLAGSIGYFAFDSMERLQMAGLVGGSSLVAVVCYLIAAYLHENREKENSPLLDGNKYDNIA